MIEEDITKVEKIVQTTLFQIGITPDDPVEMQRDMQYLRNMRRTSEAVKQKITFAMVTIMVSSMVAILVLGFKEYMRRP